MFVCLFVCFSLCMHRLSLIHHRNLDVSCVVATDAGSVVATNEVYLAPFNKATTLAPAKV